jgi:hypothetical protein
MLRRGMRAPWPFALAVVLFAPSAAADVDGLRTDPWDRRAAWSFMATTFIGDGLRFNDPYRLATPLGSSAESVSRTAGYAELGAAALHGDPLGFQHGLALRWSFAIEGVPQSVVTPSYVLWRRFREAALFARAGVPVVVSPDVTMGFEASAGAVLFVRGGIGVAAELVGDVFYGAGTREVATPAYPILAGQLGLVFAYEALP